MPRKYYRRKRKSIASDVKKNTRFIKNLKKSIEYKHEQTTEPVTTDDRCTTTPYLHNLNGTIPNASGAHDREGDKITAKRLFIRGQVVAPTDNAVVRLALVRYKKPDGAGLPTAAQIWESSASGGYVLANRNVPEARGFDVMWDQTFFLDVTENSTMLFKINKKLNTQIWYDAAAGAVGDIIDNMFVFVWMSDHADDADAPVITFNARLSFTDL